MNNKVVVQRVESGYPEVPPYDPHVRYPEYVFSEETVSKHKNDVYEAIRNSFYSLGLDTKNHGTAAWNPLGILVSPGQIVTLKPNFVMHENKTGNSLYSVVTHSSVIRAILDYVIMALKGKGTVYIADAPQFDADWDKLVANTKIQSVVEEISRRTSVNLKLVDLRTEIGVADGDIYVDRIKLKGDPNGYEIVNLKSISEFADQEYASHRLRGSDYDSHETVKHHSNGNHNYLISRSILLSDVIINIPKLKVHPKAGVSLSMKNIIGINGDKNYIPHFKVGGPLRGGDDHNSYSVLRDIESTVKDKFKSYVYSAGPIGLQFSKFIRKYQKRLVDSTDVFTIRGGSWIGNDTLWRSILDLNTILFYADKNGDICSTPQRKYICVIDGVIAGEGGGPYSNEPLHANCVVVGFEPIGVDVAATQVMGIDYRKIPKIINAINRNKHALLFANGRFDILFEGWDEKKPLNFCKLTEGWSSLNS